MELFTDLKSRFPFRSGGAREGDREGELWASLVGSDRVLMAAIDRTGRIQSANEALFRTRESEVEDLVGTSLLYQIHAEDRASFSELVREAFSGAQGGAGQGRLLRGGEWSLIVHWLLVPRRDGEGAVEEVFCLGVDLSGFLEGRESGQGAAELSKLREMVADLVAEKEALRQDLIGMSRLQPVISAEIEGSGEAVLTGPIPGLEEGEQAPTLEELERRYICHVLDDTKGRISGAKGAAAILGLHPNTLRSRMKKYGIGKEK